MESIIGQSWVESMEGRSWAPHCWPWRTGASPLDGRPWQGVALVELDGSLGRAELGSSVTAMVGWRWPP